LKNKAESSHIRWGGHRPNPNGWVGGGWRKQKKVAISKGLGRGKNKKLPWDKPFGGTGVAKRGGSLGNWGKIRKPGREKKKRVQQNFLTPSPMTGGPRKKLRKRREVLLVKKTRGRPRC